MKPRLGVSCLFIVAVTLGLGLQATAQVIREPRLRANPNRSPGAGGACVYDRDGRIVFAPKGKICRPETNYGSDIPAADSALTARYQPAMREELTQLLGEHGHLDREIVRLRQIVAMGNKQLALQEVDKLRAEMMDHRTREERFYEKMAPARAGR